MQLPMNYFSWLSSCSGKVRFDLKFPIGSLNDDLSIGETLERQRMLTAWTGEIDGNKCIGCIFLFDWNLNATGIAGNRDQERIEDFACFNRDPGQTRERSLCGQDCGFSRHEGFCTLFD